MKHQVAIDLESEGPLKESVKKLRGIFVKHLNTLGCPPAQDASHHQDYYIFRIGYPNLNLHLPLESWEGLSQPNEYRTYLQDLPIL